MTSKTCDTAHDTQGSAGDGMTGYGGRGLTGLTSTSWASSHGPVHTSLHPSSTQGRIDWLAHCEASVRSSSRSMCRKYRHTRRTNHPDALMM